MGVGFCPLYCKIQYIYSGLLYRGGLSVFRNSNLLIQGLVLLMYESIFSVCSTSYNPKMDFNRRFGSISQTLFYILSAENE